MRLLMTSDTVGGVWRFSRELTSGLLEAGDAVALVSFGREPSVAQQLECERLNALWGDSFLYVSCDTPLEWMRENHRAFGEGAAVLARISREFRAELLHTNQFCFGAARLDIPKVVTAHSDVLSWARCCRGADPEDSEWLARYCTLVQRGLDAADVVTAPTTWMMQALSEGFRLPPEQLTIPNGRSVAAQAPGERRLRAVTAGRVWDEAKDVAMLGQVLSPMPLVVVGEQECDGVRAGVLKRVELHGALGEQAILQLFANSAVYVCTSRYEPFGLAPLEAALCGCAIVARDIASLREVWGDAAFYFRDAAELSAVLKRLYEDSELLSTYQQRAGQRAQVFSQEQMVRGYRKTYAGLLDEEHACVA
jgi:glycosyltransferase involved in cell wall biosynthesis